jgi:imidazolonepropionase-like amidohydrolase
MRPILICAAIFIAASTSDAFADKKALVGGRLIDGLLGPPIADSVILIDGEMIEAVGTTDTLPVPPDYERISTEGMSVLPGLWEMHMHLMINGHSDYDHWDREYLDRFASEIMPASAHQLLLAGITTARDLGAPLEDSVQVKARIESGEIPGPRARCAREGSAPRGSRRRRHQDGRPGRDDVRGSRGCSR